MLWEGLIEAVSRKGIDRPRIVCSLCWHGRVRVGRRRNVSNCTAGPYIASVQVPRRRGEDGNVDTKPTFIRTGVRSADSARAPDRLACGKRAGERKYSAGSPGSRALGRTARETKEEVNGSCPTPPSCNAPEARNEAAAQR